MVRDWNPPDPSPGNDTVDPCQPYVYTARHLTLSSTAVSSVTSNDTGSR